MKKGQAALEFLMTYGWLILVVSLAIGATLYFQVLKPERLEQSEEINMSEEIEYEEIQAGTVWIFEGEGDSIEGELIGKVDGQFGKNFILKDSSGEETTVFGGAVLNTKLRNAEEGKMVRITYIGEVKSQAGRVYKDFKVEVAK